MDVAVGSRVRCLVKLGDEEHQTPSLESGGSMEWNQKFLL